MSRSAPTSILAAALLLCAAAPAARPEQGPPPPAPADARRARLTLHISLEDTQIEANGDIPGVTGRVRNFGRQPARLLQPTVFGSPAGYVVAEVRDAATGETVVPLGECGSSAGGPPPDDAFFSIPPGKTAALDLENVLRGYWEPLHTGRFVVGRRYRLTLRYVTRPTLRPSHGFGVEPTVPPPIRERVEALTPCDLTSNAVEFTMAPSRPVVP